MKEKLLSKHLTSRKRIDEIATKLGVSKIGSRSEIVLRISQKSYSEIKKAL